jgi:long-chain fatty acid transport protein
MNMPLRSFLLALALGAVYLGVTAPVRASGFLLEEQSAEGIGMASAVSASTLEPAAIWYDPAALVFMDGVQASLSGTLYLGQVEFTPVASGEATDSKPIRQIVPSGFASARLSDRIAVGLGVAVPFGLGVKWASDWAGRDYGIASSLMVADINPVIAFKLLPALSIAAGLDVMRGTVDLRRGLPTSMLDSVQIAGAAWGVGGNIAILYRVLPERVHVALTYRSRVKLDFSGNAHFDVQEPVFTRQLFDQPGTAGLLLPDIITLGLMYRPLPVVRLGLDADAVFWSTYDRVPIDFRSPATPDTALRPNYRDAINVRLGGEWATPLTGFVVRAGLVFDSNPAPSSGLSPAVPDAKRVDVSAGLGYQTAQLGIDVGYMLVNFLPARARPPVDPDAPPQSPAGTYRTTAHLIGLTLTGRLGSSHDEVHGG